MPLYNLLIGLSSVNNCPSDDCGLEFFRRGWRWEDDTPYLNPTWHKWDESEPDSSKFLCACVSPAWGGKWISDDCSLELPYICEKGMKFTLI